MSYSLRPGTSETHKVNPGIRFHEEKTADPVKGQRQGRVTEGVKTRQGGHAACFLKYSGSGALTAPCVTTSHFTASSRGQRFFLTYWLIACREIPMASAAADCVLKCATT